MADILIIPNNPVVNFTIAPLPALTDADLIYTGGGGSLFPNLLDDLVVNGKQAHKGNELVSIDLTIKSCENMIITNQELQVNGGRITRGLLTGPNGQTTYWDEVFCTPLGQYTAVVEATTLGPNYEIKFTNDNSDELYLNVHDINIIPKVNDYLVIQKSKEIFSNDSYTDGLNDFPIYFNCETYQFKVLAVTVITPNGADTIYKLSLDKSFKPTIGSLYNLVLLNRENTSIQKELFYDTFGQIEVLREQLLGDPYNNISDSTVPSGRKNYLNYDSSQYLGLRTLLKGIINEGNTPFIVYDINDDIRDHMLIDSANSSKNNFTVMNLPFIMFQNDTRSLIDSNNLTSIVTNGTLFNATENIGQYAGLYFDWDTTLQYRVGWAFYDLRIFVIDDSELATALTYNANRNYTIPEPKLSSNFGNTIKNPGGGVALEITNVTNTSPIEITTQVPHNLVEGTQVFISGVSVLDGTNTIVPSNANGINYIKLVYPNGITQPADPNKFTLWDVTLTTPVIGNGTFITNPNSSSGIVTGTLPEYTNFFTYRLIGKHYKSILPFSRIINFNWAKNGGINNSTDAQLKFSLDPFKFLQDSVNDIGFEAEDLEIIIGTYQNTDPSQPNLITGITDVVTIPISELAFTRNLFSTITSEQANLQDIIVTKQDYDNFVSQIGFGSPYDKVANPLGDPTYDLINNYSHYNYASGDPVPADLVVGKGKWTLGNISYTPTMIQYRTNMEITIPAAKWNDTTNPTYDFANEFVKDRYISEVGIVLTNSAGTEVPMIYAKISPAIKKTNELDITLNLSIDF